MGIYLEPRLGGQCPTKEAWIRANGRKVLDRTLAELHSEKAKNETLVFFQAVPWGANLAVAFDRAETARLFNSKSFPAVYAVLTSTLKLNGYRGG